MRKDRRAFILVMDSFGIGAAPDAARFGDTGADTLGHIAERCGGIALPQLARLGLGEAARLATGRVPKGLAGAAIAGAFAAAAEISAGKDTPSGHWEIAGCPVPVDWGYFPKTQPCFPPEVVAALIAQGNLPGILGDCHASGTEILERLGKAHIRTGKPICYTSSDSVFQIAAHEAHFGLDRLYALAALAKTLLEPYRIARVIARPFIGERPGEFKRTPRRRDLTTPPPGPTLLDAIVANGGEVLAIGKIADIFAHRGITRSAKGDDNAAIFAATIAAARDASPQSLVFSNFVDFDMLYGHRRDVAGYARALQDFDRRLPDFLAAMRPGDLALITADHGCDPTWPGSDHTREFVPGLFFGPGIGPSDLGRRESFADLGQTIAAHLGLGALAHGHACF